MSEQLVSARLWKANAVLQVTITDMLLCGGGAGGGASRMPDQSAGITSTTRCVF
jgi:hypothetical protein